MATLRDVEERIWKSVVPDLFYSEEAAIVKKWRALKEADQPIGVPVTPEVPLDGGNVAQAFTSGHVLTWTGGDQVELR